MTDEQKKWLDENPKYSPVKAYGMVTLVQWADQGYLWPNGKFSPDDGDTLFWNTGSAIRVGRQCPIV